MIGVFDTKEDICNLALVKNGATEITDIDSLTDPNAILMKRLYDANLSFLLTKTYWMFATSRVNAVVVGGALVDIDDLTEWAEDTGYAFGSTPKETVIATDHVYYCIKDHSDWAVGNYYKVGNQVVSGSNIYVCILANYSTASIPATDTDYWTPLYDTDTTNPTNGANKAVYWYELTETDDEGVYDIDFVENAWSTWGLDVIYLVPPDLVRLIGWSQPGSTIRQEQNYFLSDTPDLGILYNFFNENILQYPAHFIETFVDKLQADSCQKLTGSRSKAETLLKYFLEESLPTAKAVDSQGETTVSVKRNQWTSAKYNGVHTQSNRKVYYR